MKHKSKVFGTIVILSIINIFSPRIVQRVILLFTDSMDYSDYTLFINTVSRSINFVYVIICISILVIFYDRHKKEDKFN